ncbi:MAG: phosphatase PAP2 family protein [Spirochaetes bacterium]|nr:MAG: phosphatase PAP2 family protein [Spirochaetota bacterium]
MAMMKAVAAHLDDFDKLLCRKVSFLTGARFFDRIMYLLSASADGYLYILPAIAILVFDLQGARTVFGVTLSAFGIELIIQKAVKNLVRRERPCESAGIQCLVKPPDKFSFPSGHTAGAFLIAAVLPVFYGFSPIPLYAWASGVAFSRVYNGVHYPSDVISGAILGVASAYGAMWVIL